MTIALLITLRSVGRHICFLRRVQKTGQLSSP